MKRVVLVLLATGLLAVGAFAQAPAKAKERSVEFVLSAGIFGFVQGNDSAWASLGVELDLHAGSHFLISPQLDVFNFNSIGPGLTVSYLAGKVALGVGFLWLPGIDPEYEESTVYPKVSLGYRGRHIVVTGYVVIGHGYEVGTFIGGTIGYKF